MKIQGLQKMTLLDYPGRVACTVFLGGCDFRCPFCHNYELVEGSMPVMMEDDEFFAFLDKRHGLLDGVAVTGGEPCLRKDLPEFFRKIREKGFSVKLDTNGNNPKMLEKLIEEGLVDYVAMDVKNSPEKYAATIGLSDFDVSKVRESVEILKNAGIPYEFRTTVIDEYHDAEDFEKIGQWIRGAKQYFLQAFTDRDTVPDHSLHAPQAAKMLEYRDIAARYVESAEVRGIDV